MAIPKSVLAEMENLLSKGKNVSDTAKKSPLFECSEVYYSLSDYSILGKKRMITNRLRSLVKE